MKRLLLAVLAAAALVAVVPAASSAAPLGGAVDLVPAPDGRDIIDFGYDVLHVQGSISGGSSGTLKWNPPDPAPTGPLEVTNFGSNFDAKVDMEPGATDAILHAYSSCGSFDACSATAVIVDTITIGQTTPVTIAYDVSGSSDSSTAHTQISVVLLDDDPLATKCDDSGDGWECPRYGFEDRGITNKSVNEVDSDVATLAPGTYTVVALLDTRGNTGSASADAKFHLEVPPGSIAVSHSGLLPIHGAATGAANTPPICHDYVGQTDENAALSDGVACDELDPGDSIASYDVVPGSGPAHGTLSPLSGTGGFTYTPAAGFTGTDSFQFTATDSHGAVSNVATAAITVGNTRAGTNIGIGFPGTGVSVTFSSVTTPGETTVGPAPGAPALPANYALSDGTLFDVSTTAVYVPPVTVCFGRMQDDTAAIPDLLHYEHGAWNVPPQTVQQIFFATIHKRFIEICATLDSLSPVAIADKVVDSTPPVITADVAGTLGSNGWYTSDVSVSWHVTDAESAVSARSGCDTTAVTHDTDAAGVTLTCTATSAGGTASKSVTITRDATPPTVTFSGNAGTYAVDETVDITCAATDPAPGSGLAGAGCAGVHGPAYSFSLGVNPFSASAADRAGNVGHAAGTFTVTVTPTSLCRLTTSFLASTGQPASFCSLLANAGKVTNAVARAALVDAYDRLVAKAAAAGTLTAQQAATLTRLAAGL